MQSLMVVCGRISVKTDESTSIVRQLKAGEARAAAENGKIVGYAVDEGVSASKVRPADREGLKVWLLWRTEEFDTLVFMRLDRATRSTRDLNWLLEWAQEHKKRILLCESEFDALDSFDFRPSPVKGQKRKRNIIQDILIQFISWTVEQETDKLSERVSSTHDYLRKHGEWGGGIAPYGFIPKRISGRKRGWELVPCVEEVEIERDLPDGTQEKYTIPATEPILKRIINDLFEKKKKLNVICNELNAEGHLAPRDWWSRFRGRDSQNRSWHYATVKKMLQNRVLVGEVWHAPEPTDLDESNPRPWTWQKRRIYDDSGKPVALSKPMLTQEQFLKLQEILEENSMGRVQRYEKPNHYLGVARCARCGLELYRKESTTKGKVYQDFVCKSKNKKGIENCRQPAIASAYVDFVIREITLSLIGNEEVKKRRFVPGDDKSEEKLQIESLLRALEDEKDDGLIVDEERYRERKRKLIGRLRAIGENPVREARFEWTGTGKTYAELWDEIPPIERLEIMNGLGIRVYLGRGDASFAETAWSNQGQPIPELPVSVRLAAMLSEEEVNDLLREVSHGSWIKKDFKVWYLQEASAFPDEILAQLAAR